MEPGCLFCSCGEQCVSLLILKAYRPFLRVALLLCTAGGDGDAESAGAPGAGLAEDPTREIGDAGMVLRDPPAAHLLAHQVLRRLEAVVELQAAPREDSDLAFLTRLLQLATGARAMMKERAFEFPGKHGRICQLFAPSFFFEHVE
jgi:hypothetical protein